MSLPHQLNLVRNLRPNKRESFEHQHLHFVHRVVYLMRLLGDRGQPLRQHGLDTGPGLDLRGDAGFGILETENRYLGKT